MIDLCIKYENDIKSYIKNEGMSKYVRERMIRINLFQFVLVYFIIQFNKSIFIYPNETY